VSLKKNKSGCSFRDVELPKLAFAARQIKLASDHAVTRRRSTNSAPERRRPRLLCAEFRSRDIIPRRDFRSRDRAIGLELVTSRRRDTRKITFA